METQHSSMHISFMKENIKTKKFSNNLDSHHSADTVALVTVVHLKVLKGWKNVLGISEGFFGSILLCFILLPSTTCVAVVRELLRTYVMLSSYANT